MALDKNEIDQIRQVFNESFAEGIEALVIPRFDEMDRRFDALESDVSILKTDNSVLKMDVTFLKSDTSSLRSDMREVKILLANLEGKVMALENDIKELYRMVSDQTKQDKKFSKLTLEQKFIKMHNDFQLLAKQAGITLPL